MGATILLTVPNVIDSVFVDQLGCVAKLWLDKDMSHLKQAGMLCLRKDDSTKSEDRHQHHVKGWIRRGQSRKTDNYHPHQQLSFACVGAK